MTEVSYNGWVANPHPEQIGITHLDLPGHPNAFPPGARGGDVLTVLSYVAAQMHARVEPRGDGCWGYAYRKNRNANNLSCHASGTAIDYNAPRHPNGEHGTYTAAQVAEIRKILAEAGVVHWGGDFSGTKDEMHFEIHGTAAQVHDAAVRLSSLHHAAAKPVSKPASQSAAQAHASWWSHDLTRGDAGEAVRQAKHRLHVPLKGPHANTYTHDLEQAVASLRHAHGLTPPGGAVIDARTSLLIGG